MKAPGDQRRRAVLCASLLFAAPLATAAITVCLLEGMNRSAPGGLTQAGFMMPYLVGALLGAAGSAAAALALPVRYWLRIALAVACFLAVFVAFPVFCFVANEALHAAVGIGPLTE